jgi:hypothetical protein
MLFSNPNFRTGYCLQTLIGAVILHFIGYTVFRISNSQKAEVRKESARSSRISGIMNFSLHAFILQ